nr:hypothetical protein CFP56_01253 [Quercus suber]
MQHRSSTVAPKYDARVVYMPDGCSPPLNRSHRQSITAAAITLCHTHLHRSQAAWTYCLMSVLQSYEQGQHKAVTGWSGSMWNGPDADVESNIDRHRHLSIQLITAVICSRAGRSRRASPIISDRQRHNGGWGVQADAMCFSRLVHILDLLDRGAVTLRADRGHGYLCNMSIARDMDRLPSSAWVHSSQGSALDKNWRPQNLRYLIEPQPADACHAAALCTYAVAWHERPSDLVATALVRCEQQNINVPPTDAALVPLYLGRAAKRTKPGPSDPTVREVDEVTASVENCLRPNDDEDTISGGQANPLPLPLQRRPSGC